MKQSDSCQIIGLAEIYQERFGDVPGHFVDVGAHDGYSWSNTWGLAQAGWTGLMIEPDETLAERCRELYLDNSGVTVVQMAAGETDGSIQLYYGTKGELPTTDADTVRLSPWGYKFDPDNYKVVWCNKLDTLLARFEFHPGLEVISIDVEGAELSVLRGLTLNLWKPKMLIVETHEKHPDPGRRLHAEEIDRHILNFNTGYIKIHSDAINSIYWRQDG